MALNLHSTEQGQGPDLVLLHGLFGMGSNLGALARALAQRYRVISLDLPNHGRSLWRDNTDIPDMAQMLATWMTEQGLDRASLVGHSLGGKVAMELALRQPERVRSLVVADIAPVSYPPGHHAEFAALEAVAQAHCASRTAAGELMAGYLEDETLIQFLLKSVYRHEDGDYRWRFHREELVRSYGAYRAANSPGLRYDGPVLFIKGGESNYIQEAHRPEILARFPAATLKIMPGCSHWLHAQQPVLFNAIVARFLDQH